ncbi:MAG: serine hydrolase [Armatimonas sp.]
MTLFRIPGVSITVIENNKIAWASGYGVTELGGKEKVTPHTLFQAASISKPVTAVGAMCLVEREKLSLDEDVNQRLTSWKVPQSEFTTQEKVTLRRILSHGAGFNVHGFGGYLSGRPVPTLVQILNGEKPASSEPIRVTSIPGSVCRYSGGGFTVAAQLMTDAAGKPFETILSELVFRPAGMRDSTFQQVLPPALAKRAATGTRSNGKSVPGRWRLYPELAPDGMWTTPTDLAKLALELTRAKQGKRSKLLSQQSVEELLKVQIKGGDGPVGLGFGVGYVTSPDLFRHNGGNDGFAAHLLMFADHGQGYAAMGNSDEFATIEPWLRSAIARRYGWKYTLPSVSAGDILILVYGKRGLPAALDQHARIKAGQVSGVTQNMQTLNRLGYFLLRLRNFAESITVFRQNVVEYPDDANVYDSLGEAYMAAGDKENAIQNYAKSLELNPKNDNAAQQLKALKAGK